ncbi:lysozyme [Muribaculum intestinale]|uniref:lysozyme n=1 Tax=Muribaculum intestinale TaxID=1796646 RepID=UPI0025A9AAD0|nr:lysozyme [Muribaculum intestinale]
MRKIMMLFVALLTLVAATPAAHAKRSIMELPLFERAVLIIKKFETLHKPKHWPYVGYGHCVQPGDPYRRGCQLTERQADALLRKDLRKFVSLYKHMGEKNAILLGTLAYNIGPGAVNKSSVYRKLKRGDTNIYKEYTSHCHYKGKFHRQLHQRRQTEYKLLFSNL